MDWRDLMQRHRTHPAGPTAGESRPAPARVEAKSLVRTCLEYGVGLRLEADGTLVVVSNGHAWRALISEIEMHAEEIAELLADAWDPHDA